MRVVVSVDMEAVGQIVDVREVLACRREYWMTGRSKLTAEVVAAASGLLDGGASEVVVLDNHGSGNPWNVIVDDLPARVRAESWNVYDLSDRDVDGMLQVGYHPRAGVAGFVPHSYVPGLRLRVNGEEIGESHGRIWAAETVLLGIVGHAAHERTLGSLAGTPFLAVQGGTDPHLAIARYADAAEGAEAVREFAREQMHAIGSAPRPFSPAPLLFEATVDAVSEDAAVAMSDAGWERKRDDAFAVELSVWSDARAPLAAAMAAAFEPFAGDMMALELTSEEAFECQPDELLESLTMRFLESTGAAVAGSAPGTWSAGPGPMAAMTEHPELLERDAQLAQLRGSLAEASGGRGGATLVLAGAGLGKTALVRAAERMAVDAGFTLLSARGGELEREMSFGIVRQLFEHTLVGLGGAEREMVLAGAARLALPAVVGTAGTSWSRPGWPPSPSSDCAPSPHLLSRRSSSASWRSPRARSTTGSTSSCRRGDCSRSAAGATLRSIRGGRASPRRSR